MLVWWAIMVAVCDWLLLTMVLGDGGVGDQGPGLGMSVAWLAGRPFSGVTACLARRWRRRQLRQPARRSADQQAYQVEHEVIIWLGIVAGFHPRGPCTADRVRCSIIVVCLEHVWANRRAGGSAPGRPLDASSAAAGHPVTPTPRPWPRNDASGARSHQSWERRLRLGDAPAGRRRWRSAGCGRPARTVPARSNHSQLFQRRSHTRATLVGVVGCPGARSQLVVEPAGGDRSRRPSAGLRARCPLPPPPPARRPERTPGPARWSPAMPSAHGDLA